MVTRVLIADDHKQMLSSLSQTIHMIDRSWEIYEAEDGQAAVEKAASVKPDLIILDWRMPRLNGLEAGKAIRKQLPKAVMLIYTVTPAVYLDAVAREAGFQGVVEKMDGRGLVSAICDALPVKAFGAGTSPGSRSAQEPRDTAGRGQN
ncbi:MAG: response regulator transcription factor [Candidatus Acidiferrales bacterium]